MTSPAVALTATGDALVSAKPIADRINAAHEAFEAAERRALEHAVRAGRLLEEVKQDLKRRFGHGHFGRWIKRHCRFGWRRGEEYMQAAKWVSANAREAAEQALALFERKGNTVTAEGTRRVLDASYRR